MVIKLYGYDKDNHEVFLGTFANQKLAHRAIKNSNLKFYFFYRNI